MSELITSAQNPKIKKLLALQQKSSERRECGLFVVEGVRELQHCVEAGYEVDSVFRLVSAGTSPASNSIPDPSYKAEPINRSGTLPATNSIPDPSHKAEPINGSETLPASNSIPDPSHKAEPINGFGLALDAGKARTGAKMQWRVFDVSPEVYGKIAYRGSTEGVIAEVRTRELKLGDLKLGKNPLIVVLESVEKPGNLGAVLRSADAAGADAVIVCDPLTDLYNPNLIRSSIGGVFTVPTVACTSEEAIKWLKGNGIQILTAQLQDSSYYYDTDMKRGTAIVMGTEATGLTDVWRKAADAHILIPMLGSLDSLNVSVSAAILLFEAVRQRRQI